MEAMVRDIPVNYEEFGTGIPVLILHGGGPIDHRAAAAVMEPLFENRPGWWRIYPDMPGFGKTPGSEWITSHDQMLEVLIEFMQTVAPDQRFVVVGASYGGYLAQGLVYKQGDMIDGVCLIVPVIELDLTKQQYPAHQIIVEDPQFVAALMPEEQVFLNMFVAQSVDALEDLRNILQPAANDEAFLTKLGKNFAFSFPVNKLTTPFPAPAVILAGRQDSICGYREAWAMLDDYPRATFAVLDRAGHPLFVEQKALFQALTSEWLDRVEEYIAQTSA